MIGEPSHPIPTGTMVLVHHVIVVRRPFALGPARIVAPVSGAPGVYRVRFDGERIDQVRFVLDGPFQAHSEECIAALRRLWRANLQHGLHVGLLPLSDGGAR